MSKALKLLLKFGNYCLRDDFGVVLDAPTVFSPFNLWLGPSFRGPRWAFVSLAHVPLIVKKKKISRKSLRLPKSVP